jgi:hypothetical protein
MTVFYILIAVIVGWFIGFLDSNLRTAKKIQAAEAHAELMVMEAERKIAQAEQKFANTSKPPQTQQDDPSLLLLKRNNGRYMLELDGAPVKGELSQDMRKRLVELITVFRLWLEPGQTSPSASQPAASTSVSRPSVPDPLREAVYGPQVVSQPLPDPLVREAAYGSSTQAAPKPISPVKKPELEKNIVSMSIVQQIDTVLQARLENTPLERQGIRLQESIQGGVEVYVGLEKYLSVDEVPDEVVKTAIRAAIAEWEKKYTPGM